MANPIQDRLNHISFVCRCGLHCYSEAMIPTSPCLCIFRQLDGWLFDEPMMAVDADDTYNKFISYNQKHLLNHI